MTGIPLDNDEIVTPRDLQRKLNGHLARLQAGDIDKLVLMRGSTMEAVVLRVEDYEKLLGK